MGEKSLYIVLSQTGTVLSRVLKFFTRAEYNHSSIALNPSLDKMYSYGRLNPYNPFRGGFVEEGKNIGTFKRFYKTKAVVLEIKVGESEYNGIKDFIEYMVKNKCDFHYNYWGVFLAMFRKNHAPNNKFYCSQFVRTCLTNQNIQNSTELPKIIKPIDFLKLNNIHIVYKGLLSNYN